MKDIAIYGAGGFGREVACLINEINSFHKVWNLIGFFDDGKKKEERVSSFGKILGGLEDLNTWNKELAIVLCFGNPNVLRRVRENISNTYIDFPNLISPDFIIRDETSLKIGEGNIIKGHCVLTTEIKIGDFNIFNGNVMIGHDVNIGSYNILMPGVRVSGEVNIGNQNLLGAGCFIKQQLSVGDKITISPLSALLTKPKNGCTYIGNPAKLFKF